jgi:hypothetical protein
MHTHLLDIRRCPPTASQSIAVMTKKKSGGQHSRSAAELVHHHVCTVLLLHTSGLLLSWLVTGSICLIVFGVLDVNLLAAGFGLSVVVVSGASSVLSTCHGGVFALGSDALALNFLLFFLFLDAVLVSVGVEVGLRLLRGELRRRRLVRIPVTISLAQKSRILNCSHTT